MMMETDRKEQEFQVDFQDERINKVFTDPSFAIDPTNPKFDHRKTGKIFT